jgi:hypothetical protein
VFGLSRAPAGERLQANHELSGTPPAAPLALSGGGSKATCARSEKTLLRRKIRWLRGRSWLPVTGLSIHGSMALETRSLTALVLPTIGRRADGRCGNSRKNKTLNSPPIGHFSEFSRTAVFSLKSAKSGVD